jgi:hypothetical protein
MAEQDLDRVGVQPISVPNFDAGIITSLPATELPDNAMRDCLNWEFDDEGNISTRSGVEPLFADTFPGRITSLHYYTTESDGEVGLLITTGDELWIVQTDGSGLTELTGALTLPSDRFWQWRTFQGLAVGVNGATSGSNPVKVNAASVASALGGGGGTAPKGRYIEVWNSRIWIAGGAEKNTLFGSALGLAEEWDLTDAGADDAAAFEVDPDDGDEIMGIHAGKDALYIWKRRRIFRTVVIDPTKPAEDITNLRIELFADNIGTVSGYSIQTVLDDTFYLSEQGLASLQLSQQLEDFRTAMLSRNISEIQRMPKTTDEIPGFVLDTGSQYHLSIPSTISPTQSAQAYVLDYSQGPLPNQVRWTRFDGKLAATAYTAWVAATGKVFVLGALTGDGSGEYGIYLYRPKDTNPAFSDDGVGYVKSIKTKAYNAGEQLIEKWWKKWGLALSLLTDSAQLSVKYYFDGIESNGGTYPGFSLTGNTSGARWDSAIWDVSLWDSAVAIPTDIWREPLVNGNGERGADITFIFSNAQDGEGLQIRDFRILYSLLTEKDVDDTI